MDYDSYQHYFFDDLDKEEDCYKSTAPSEDIWKKFWSWLSNGLGQDEEFEEFEGPYRTNTAEPFGNHSSIIIQDCMLSSFSAGKQLGKVNERLSSAAQPRPPSTPPSAVIKAQCASPDAPLATTLAAECVDPTAVLTFPANSCRKPASLGSESRSDSSGKETTVQ